MTKSTCDRRVDVNLNREAMVDRALLRAISLVVNYCAPGGEPLGRLLPTSPAERPIHH